MNYDPETQKILLALGQEIRRLRKHHSWTQEALAEWATVNDKEVSQIELGHRNISLQVLLRFARALNVDPSVLLKKALAASKETHV